MHRGRMFWGLVLVLLGLLFLVANFIAIDVWALFWPLVLICLGGWVLWQTLWGDHEFEVQEVSLPLEGAAAARVRLHYAAGQLRVHGGAPAGLLVSGRCGGDVKIESQREGERLEVKLSTKPEVFFTHPQSMWNIQSREWDLALSEEVPLILEIGSGASDVQLDLTYLRVTELKIETGASATTVQLPATAGFTRVDVDSGMASVKLHVPEGVAARIHTDGGLAGFNINEARFPKVSDNTHRSPDYDTAANKIEIDVETGVGSLEVH